MKALSLLQPWASLIAVGAKTIETRSWATKYRGLLAIHASKKITNEQLKLCANSVFKGALELDCNLPSNYLRSKLLTGKVLATCKLIDCIQIPARIRGTNAPRNLMGDQGNIYPISLTEATFGDYTPGRYAWILGDIKPLSEPMPAKGYLGLWNWDGEPDGSV